MDKMNNLRDVLTRWESDIGLRTALKKAKNLDDFRTVLEDAQIFLPPEELKKVEAMLRLKDQQQTVNVDLDKKINK